MSHWRARVTSPLGLALTASAITYIGFLLWPSSSWSDRVGGAIDWVGGALIIVGPLVAATVADLTSSAHRDVSARVPSNERQPGGARATLLLPLALFVALHVVVLAIAAGVALWQGARDTALVPFAFRHVAALGAFAAVGYIPGLWWRWRGMVPSVAVGIFALSSAAMASGHGLVVATGGLPLVSSWHRVAWAPLTAQMVLWLGILVTAAMVDLRTRQLTRSGVVLAGIAAVAMLATVPAALGQPYSPVVTAAEARVNCEEAQGVQVCLAPGSEAWKPSVEEVAARTYSALAKAGVATPATVVEIGGSLSRAFSSAPGDLDDGHAISLAYERPGEGVPLALIGELVVDPRCQSEAVYVPEEAMAWLYAQVGEDIYPDMTARVTESATGSEWLAEVFSHALACWDAPYPPLSG